MDVAAAEAVRAVQRGASRAEAGVLLGDIFAKRGLHGEALERYREARSLEPGRADARLGEVKALFALGGPRAEEARALAEELLELTPDNVDAQSEQGRSEEHTSELQSPDHLVCRLLLEKKKKT